jgi:hypothetical protein
VREIFSIPPGAHAACDAEIARLRARAEIAEAKLGRITEAAETWAALAPPDDWGETPASTVTADIGRAILAITGEAQDVTEKVAEGIAKYGDAIHNEPPEVRYVSSSDSAASGDEISR